jgi:hypothetical protein
VGEKCERRSDRKDWKRWLEGNLAVNMEKSEVKFWRGSNFPTLQRYSRFHIRLGFEFSTKSFKISVSSFIRTVWPPIQTRGMDKLAAQLDKYRAAGEKARHDIQALDIELKVVTGGGARRRAAEAVCRESVGARLVGCEARTGGRVVLIQSSSRV